MRGVAVLAAAGSAWVLVTGVTPQLGLRRHRLRPRVALLCAAAGVVAAVLAAGVVQVPIVAGAIGALAAAVPATMEAERRRIRREAVAAAWPDVLARMRARLAGGSTLVEALTAALDAAPSELSRWRNVVDESVRYGSGLPDALEQMREALADPIADRVTMTLGVANVAGGRTVGEVLAALSASVADELRMRRAHHAATTEQRLTAVVALVAPWALLALTLATNPQAADSYRTAAGASVVLIGLAGTGIGYLAAARSARLSEPPRVFG